MVERLKKIPKQLLEKWKSFTNRQRTIIISAVGMILIALILLVVLTGRITYTQLRVCTDAAEAASVADILKENQISYRLEDDRLTISVDAKKYSDAFLLLASSDIPSTGISVDELLNNSLSTTNSDRNLKLNLYLQNQLKTYLKTMTGVEEAEVYYIPQDNTTSILTTEQQTSASVLLRVNDDFQAKTAETIAEVVASVIGNKSTDNIKVADQNGNLLFGGNQDLYSGSASSTEDYKERLRNTFINNLYMGLMKSGFDDVEIMPNLVFNMDEVTQLFTEYLPADGQEQGLYSKSYTYNSENAGTSGGEPGTSSNDGTDYMVPDSSSSNALVEIEQYDYLPNTRVTNTKYEIGAIKPEESSISVVLRKLVTHKEEDLKTEGLLDDITFDEYVLQNSDRIKLDVDNDVVQLISFATGISENNIKVIAYEQPVYVPKVVTSRHFSDYIQYILAALIVGLIFFVVFKGTSPIEVTELEPELSVEQLLATTQDNQNQQDIEFNEVSETRRTIEKFVDEKPEAVAQLLRNWLNEDWE